MSNDESLLDTFPGRLFIEHMRSFGGLGIAEEVIRAANWAVGSYLYSDRCLGVLDFDVSEPELRAYDTASLAALSALPSFGSPQIHQGTIGELHPPKVHFDVTHARVVRIDSARDWAGLIDAHPATAGGCKYPDWTGIAGSWDAVHLSPAGLLLAHPKISATPFRTTDGSGYAHSEAGPYADVAHWSAVCTAWLREPPNVLVKPAPGETPA